MIFFEVASLKAFEWHVWYSLTQNCVNSTQNTEFNLSAWSYIDIKMLKNVFFWIFDTIFFKTRPDGEKRIADSGSPKKGLPGKYVLFLETNSC